MLVEKHGSTFFQFPARCLGVNAGTAEPRAFCCVRRDFVFAVTKLYPRRREIKRVFTAPVSPIRKYDYQIRWYLAAVFDKRIYDLILLCEAEKPCFLILAGDSDHTLKILGIRDISYRMPSDKRIWSYKKLRIYLSEQSFPIIRKQFIVFIYTASDV